VNKNNILKIILCFAVVAGLIAFATYSFNNTRGEELQYSELVELFDREEIAYFTINLSNGNVQFWRRNQVALNDEGQLRPLPEYRRRGFGRATIVSALFETNIDANVRDYNRAVLRYNEEVLQHNEENPDNLRELRQPIGYDFDNNNTAALLASVLPMVLIGGLVVVVFIMMMRRTNNMISGENRSNMNFGKARLRLMQKDDKRKTRFDDVAGAEEEKEELQEIVEFLRNPEKFSELGARIPKGVLLVGPPGTGKTLIARAVAGEADVPFFSISGSDFVELYVGVGASRVRDMFTQAKKAAPSIVFIDEIDAVGRQRGAGMGGGHDEREQTLNQLLVEMDGFGTNEGVIIIAATNRPDILDPALLRPGRFDRQVTVLVPDVKGREAILRVHARNKPLAPDVDLKVIAQTTAGFTGADLENLLNEAALLAARHNHKAITRDEIEAAMLKVVIGTQKKSQHKTEKDFKLLAYHEAGHAVASYYLDTQDDVHQISIISRGMAGGYTMYLPQNDKNFISKTDMEEDIVSLLGGRVAEALVLGDISTGASNDIERATRLAKDMVMRYGMSSELGPIAYTTNSEVFLGRDYGQTRSYSEHMAENIDIEIKKVIETGYKHAENILNANMQQLHNVANVLLKLETISGEQFKQVMAGETLPEMQA